MLSCKVACCFKTLASTIQSFNVIFLFAVGAATEAALVVATGITALLPLLPLLFPLPVVFALVRLTIDTFFFGAGSSSSESVSDEEEDAADFFAPVVVALALALAAAAAAASGATAALGFILDAAAASGAVATTGANGFVAAPVVFVAFTSSMANSLFKHHMHVEKSIDPFCRFCTHFYIHQCFGFAYNKGFSLLSNCHPLLWLLLLLLLLRLTAVQTRKSELPTTDEVGLAYEIKFAML